MINLSFDDNIKQEFAKLLGQKSNVQVAKSYPKPNYAYKSFAILVPIFPPFGWSDQIWNVYEHVDRYLINKAETTIIHGHNRHSYCRNDKYCHVYGYRPTGNEDPKFIENFYKKWDYLNEAATSLPESSVTQQSFDFGIEF